MRLGLRYVAGLRREIGLRIEEPRTEQRGGGEIGEPLSVVSSLTSQAGACGRCPKCGCEDDSMIERVGTTCFCNVCAHEWGARSRRGEKEAEAQRMAAAAGSRFASIEDFVNRTGIHRDELRTLADTGALNAFGYDRRTAMWQIEAAMRASGELYQETSTTESGPPLKPMTIEERIIADYDGMGLTIGPHPMALRRQELALRGVLPASDLPSGRHGRRVRVAGAVITRQRPGTAKGFVFLTLEDETGIANIIVRPDVFAEQRRAVVGEPYLIVEGTLQIQEGVTSVKAERFYGMSAGADVTSRDFH